MEDDEFELEVEFAISDTKIENKLPVEGVAEESPQSVHPRLAFASSSSTVLLDAPVQSHDIGEDQLESFPFDPTQHEEQESNYLMTNETWATTHEPTPANAGSSYDLPALPDELDMEAASVEAASRQRNKAEIIVTEFDDNDEFGSVLDDAIITTSLPSTIGATPALLSIPVLVDLRTTNDNEGEYSSSTPSITSTPSIIQSSNEDEFSISSSPKPLPSLSSPSSLLPSTSFDSSAPHVAVLDLDSLNSEAMSTSSITTSASLPRDPLAAVSSLSSISSFNLPATASLIQPSQNALLELQASLIAEDVAASTRQEPSQSQESKEKSSVIPTKIVSVVRAGPLTSVGEEDEEDEDDDDDNEEEEDEIAEQETQPLSTSAIEEGSNGASESDDKVDSNDRSVPSTSVPPSALSAEEADLEAEFERATASAVAQLAAQAASAPPPEATPKKRLPLAFSVAASHLLSEQKTKPFLSSIIPTAADPESTCLSRLLAQKLSASLVVGRDAIFCVAKAQFDPHDSIHEHLLMTLFSSLTNTEAILGRTSWQTIGFQRDNDFTTDLRGGGLLGPLQALALIEGRPWLAKAMYQASQDPISGFPFMIQSISLTAKVLQALRIGSLNGLCNAAASSKTLYPVLSAVNDFHAALALAFTRKWRESGATISRMGHIMQEVIPPLCKRPDQAIASLIEAEKVKKVLTASSSSTPSSGSSSFSKY